MREKGVPGGFEEVLKGTEALHATALLSGKPPLFTILEKKWRATFLFSRILYNKFYSEKEIMAESGWG
jgi:hypothetical protein